jgi:predicted protein tyrosine phosphatase
VSILDPDFETPALGYSEGHLRLSFHDVHTPAKGAVLPSARHISDLVSFVGDWSRRAPLLVHCRAGIGRSTAAAFVVACLHNPDASERFIAEELRRVAPLARPNETLIRLADEIMRRSGRMSAAISETGKDLSWIEVDEGEPFELSSTYDSR